MVNWNAILGGRTASVGHFGPRMFWQCVLISIVLSVSIDIATQARTDSEISKGASNHPTSDHAGLPLTAIETGHDTDTTGKMEEKSANDSATGEGHGEVLDIVVDCHALRPGQYLCDEYPDIDENTQQPRGCQENGKAPGAIKCRAGDKLVCQNPANESGTNVFYKDADCLFTNAYHFDTALLLSVFLGMFGADRFYLGYPALGLLKFSTLGFFFLGHLLDVILIATQVVGPADQSHYVISYFGPAVTILTTDNTTERYPQSDWY